MCDTGHWKLNIVPVIEVGVFKFFIEVLNRLRMYGNGYSMAIVLDHRSTALTETKIGEC